MSPAATLFLAVRPSPEVVEHISPLLGELARLSPSLRTVRADGLHLTLQFLGRVSPEREKEVGSAGLRAAARVAPFTLTLGGMGSFSAASRPRVIWLGVSAGGAELEVLTAALREELDADGLPSDRRPFRPHCTLARVRADLDVAAAAGLAGIAELRRAGPELAFPVAEVQLLESVAVAGGANRYRTRRAFPLAV